MKEIKNYIHHYLGCQAQWSDARNPEEPTVMGELIEIGNHTACIEPEDCEYHECAPFEVKPKLFPLASMFKKEVILDEICEAIGVAPHLYYQAHPDILNLLAGNNEECSLEIGAREMAEITRILCKYSIDVFGLIEEGLAIDATKG